jgi:hypothetical protein
MSPLSSRAAWIGDLVVLACRTLAVMELCRHVLGDYRGIWTLVRNLLPLTAALVVLPWGLVVSLKHGALDLLTFHIAAQLALAIVVVALLLLARYYQVIPNVAERFLAASLCLYSCFSLANDIVLQYWPGRYPSAGNVVDLSAFVATAPLWLHAFLRQTPQGRGKRFPCLDSAVYRTISPQINSRLRSLSRELARVYGAGAPAP